MYKEQIFNWNEVLLHQLCLHKMINYTGILEAKHGGNSNKNLCLFKLVALPHHKSQIFSTSFFHSRGN